MLGSFAVPKAYIRKRAVKIKFVKDFVLVQLEDGINFLHCNYMIYIWTTLQS